MMRLAPITLLLALGALPAAPAAAAESPYAGQETRAIASLSPEEVQGYLAGEGKGMARAAELNGHPGPAHVRSSSRASSG
ncbi:MAG: hypothetical protein U5K43_03955 [Halofilum sp. (in: g-proteobacteria)]|nr:hypothetical protein [Halofilum sp. (in: g-proteobacteria)]